MWYGHFRISLSVEGYTETHPVVEWNPENLRKKRGEPASEEYVIYLSWVLIDVRHKDEDAKSVAVAQGMFSQFCSLSFLTPFLLKVRGHWACACLCALQHRHKEIQPSTWFWKNVVYLYIPVSGPLNLPLYLWLLSSKWFFLYFIDKTINQITVKIICRLINNKTIVSCGPTSYLVLSR